MRDIERVGYADQCERRIECWREELSSCSFSVRVILI
jgi:hypothetical protein